MFYVHFLPGQRLVVTSNCTTGLVVIIAIYSKLPYIPIMFYVQYNSADYAHNFSSTDDH